MQRPMKEDDLDEANPDRPAVTDRVRGILNSPETSDEAQPQLKRRAQSSDRYLRSKHGMKKDQGETASDMYAMYEEELDEALSPEELKQKREAGLAKAKADRDWSSRSKGSRLTGHRRGTGSYDRSIKTEYESVEQDAEIVEDDSQYKYVNEHESVDNFLDMYKEFKIRGEKK